jgi:hypothetical protein
LPSSRIAPAQREFANCRLGIADIEKHHCLDIVDAVYPQSFQLKFYHLQELAVETLDERNDFLDTGNP